MILIVVIDSGTCGHEVQAPTQKKINTAIGKENVKNKESYKRSILLVKKEEYLVFHALMIDSVIYVQQGAMLWKDARKIIKNKRGGLSGDPDFGKFMKWQRFKQIKLFIPIVVEDITMRDDCVDWWQFNDHVINHNESKKKKNMHHMYLFLMRA